MRLWPWSLVFLPGPPRHMQMGSLQHRRKPANQHIGACNKALVTVQHLVPGLAHHVCRSSSLQGMAVRRAGFNEVFPLSSLACFYEDEIEAILCGASEVWSVDLLADIIKFDHGWVHSCMPTPRACWSSPRHIRCAGGGSVLSSQAPTPVAQDCWPAIWLWDHVTWRLSVSLRHCKVMHTRCAVSAILQSWQALLAPCQLCLVKALCVCSTCAAEVAETQMRSACIGLPELATKHALPSCTPRPADACLPSVLQSLTFLRGGAITPSSLSAAWFNWLLDTQPP